MEYGCGQCMPCRINRRRVWTARLLLESQIHERKCALTLTYDQEHYPPGGSLQIRDYQLFLKRLRRWCGSRIVYYIVGEYGDVTWRPHYHALIFGFDFQEDLLQLEKLGKNNGKYYSHDASLVLKAWSNGNIHRAEFDPQFIGYVCKHITKGLKKSRDMPEGLLPEFARMSLKPAIGKNAISSLADFTNSYYGCRFVHDTYDVPASIRFDKRVYQLGRYLTQQIRMEAGYDKEWPEQAKKKREKELYDIYMEKGHDAFEDKRINDARKADFIYRKQKAKGSI